MDRRSFVTGLVVGGRRWCRCRFCFKQAKTEEASLWPRQQYQPLVKQL